MPQHHESSEGASPVSLHAGAPDDSRFLSSICNHRGAQSVTTCNLEQRKAVSRGVVLALLLVPPVSLLGCTRPMAPVDPPSGGTTLALDYDEFVANVEPVLAANGCDAGGDCHGGGIRGTFELSPSGAKNVRFDYDQAVLQVRPVDRDSSHLLTKPLALAAGGVPHAVKPFATVGDPGYQAIHLWIQHGVTR
jgi:hypothetical protein